MRSHFPIVCSRPELVDFLLNCLLRNAFFWSICGRPGFCSHIFAKLGSRPELVDFLLNCLLRNAFFGRSAVIRTFAITFLQFWATDLNSSVSYYCLLRNAFFDDLRSSGLLRSHFLILGSRQFLLHCLCRNAFVCSICGHPDFGQPSRARWFPNNLCVEKAFFGPICGHPDFCSHVLQLWAADLNSSSSY